MDEFRKIHEHNANRKLNILKSFIDDDVLEKAKNRQVGEMHPNGKWVWSKTPKGFDWRTAKKGTKETSEKKTAKPKTDVKNSRPRKDGKAKPSNFKMPKIKEFKIKRDERIDAKYKKMGGHLTEIMEDLKEIERNFDRNDNLAYEKLNSEDFKTFKEKNKEAFIQSSKDYFDEWVDDDIKKEFLEEMDGYEIRVIDEKLIEAK